MNRPWFLLGGLVFLISVILSCEVRPKPIQLTAGYRSDIACVPRQQACPWANLERQAKFAALVNCLLTGATILRTGEPGMVEPSELAVVAPAEPRYGYEHVTDPRGGRTCPSPETACQVASRYEREITWATCG